LHALLSASQRNLEAAKANLDSFEETAFKAAYDAMLQVARVVVLSAGYRPIDGEQHKTTFAAAGVILGKDFEGLIRKIQSFRIKRNNCVYDPLGFVSYAEAKAIINVCVQFWNLTREYLQKQSSQLELFPRQEMVGE